MAVTRDLARQHNGSRPAPLIHRFACDVCGLERETRVPRVVGSGVEPPWDGWATIWTLNGTRIDLCPDHRP